MQQTPRIADGDPSGPSSSDINLSSIDSERSPNPGQGGSQFQQNFLQQNFLEAPTHSVLNVQQNRFVVEGTQGAEVSFLAAELRMSKLEHRLEMSALHSQASEAHVRIMAQQRAQFAHAAQQYRAIASEAAQSEVKDSLQAAAARAAQELSCVVHNAQALLDEETLALRQEAHGAVQGAELQVTAQARTWTEHQATLLQEKADAALRKSQHEYEERVKTVQASRDALGS